MLEVQQITKSYENQPLLQGVSFSVAQGETICLLGASGSGKSTLLRIITGLESAESGHVFWDGQDLANVPVHHRHFGLMFQDYALFPHRSVAENIAFGLRMQNLPKAEIAARTAQALAQVNLERFGNRRVTDLSGGEQQRVALARTLAPHPLLLMLDEPLGALDRALREQLIGEVRQVLHRSGIPAIYVTHDQAEAFAIADRLVLLNHGRVAQSGTPEEIYHHPASAWVAHFLGLGTLLPGTLNQDPPPRVQTSLGTFHSTCLPPHGGAIQLLVRPSAASLTPLDGDLNRLTGKVSDAVFRGEHYRVQLTCGEGLQFEFDLPQAAKPGEPLTVWLKPEAILCLEDEK
ncbi:MAG TPA: ABC transporter ATP-binding protein [Anaerolineaceae bacterium]|nr:ABC transporter ATP-binding protein [Anaerolineaceae bacterium]